MKDIVPVGAPPRGDVRELAVEQVMRVTGDEVAALEVAGAPDSTMARAAALGRLMRRAGMHLTSGCPLAAWASGTDVDDGWRLAYPPEPGSLFAELQFLLDLYAPTSGRLPARPWFALLALRARAAVEFRPPAARPLLPIVG